VAGLKLAVDFCSEEVPSRLRSCGRCGFVMPSLSKQERAIIARLADGLQTKEIAHDIERSKATVEGYIRLLFVKFNVQNRAHLIAMAYDVGVLTPRHYHET